MSPPFQIPIIKRQDQIPDRLIRFSDIAHIKDYQAGVHFFIDDYRFECLWNCFQKYVCRLSKYQFVLSPDYSLYTNMPHAQQIWNTYRSRLLGAAMQSLGINIIPSVSWSDTSSFDFCFDGIERNSVVAISTRGICRKKEFLDLFLEGFNAMVRKIDPKAIIVYGIIPELLQDKRERIFHFPACKSNKYEVSYLKGGR